MRKMLLRILEVMILQFIVVEGQMAPNPYAAEHNRPYLTPNTSPGMERNRYPPTRNSEQSNYENNPRNDERYSIDSHSNENDPAYSSSNNNNPANYNSNKNPAFYNSDSNHPSYFNPNNGRAPDFNSNNNPSTLSTNNNRNGERNFPNEEYPENNSQKGQSVRDPYATGYNNPAELPPNNHNPPNNDAPNNQNSASSSIPNEEPNFPFYIYYQTDPLKSGRIVCLFNAAKFLKSGFKPTMVPARLCTIVNYEFAILNSTTYEINPGNRELDYGQKFYNKTVGLKYFNPYLKVMLSLGGWADSTKKYSDLVASPKKINNFVTKAVQFIKSHRFDGLDVAWEYPNCWQGALGVSPDDKPNFVKFLQKIRKAFDSENLLLSISVSAIKREIKAGYNGTEIAKAVHFINVMSYDMHGPWEKTTGHHTQFDKKSNDSDPSLNSKAAMEFWASIGVPKIKLNMGIATYATTFTLQDPKKHGLGAPVTGPGKAGALSHSGGILYYREICQFWRAGNWTEEQDKDVGFYAHSGDQWAGYDHPLMVVRKVKWIAENGYGGVLIKDVSGDDYQTKCFTKRFPLIWIAGMEFRRRLEEMK